MKQIDLTEQLALPESEIEELAGRFDAAVQAVVKGLILGVNVETTRERAKAKLSVALGLLLRLEVWVLRWAERVSAETFEEATDRAEELLPETQTEAEEKYQGMARRALSTALNDPVSGLVPGLLLMIRRMRDAARSYESSTANMRQERNLGLSMAAFSQDVEARRRGGDKRAVVAAALSGLAFFDVARRLTLRNGSGGAAQESLLALLYGPPGAAGARLATRDWVGTLARSKLAQIATVARRAAFLGRGEHLVLVSSTRSTHGDACDLYAGKAFAIKGVPVSGTPLIGEGDASAPHVSAVPISRLPSGGPPFHPHCLHAELPFSRAIQLRCLRDPRARAAVLEPPPRWALDRSWKAVQAEYQRRGGAAMVSRFNGALKVMVECAHGG